MGPCLPSVGMCRMPLTTPVKTRHWQGTGASRAPPVPDRSTRAPAFDPPHPMRVVHPTRCARPWGKPLAGGPGAPGGEAHGGCPIRSPCAVERHHRMEDRIAVMPGTRTTERAARGLTPQAGRSARAAGSPAPAGSSHTLGKIGEAGGGHQWPTWPACSQRGGWGGTRQGCRCGKGPTFTPPPLQTVSYQRTSVKSAIRIRYPIMGKAPAFRPTRVHPPRSAPDRCPPPGRRSVPSPC